MTDRGYTVRDTIRVAKSTWKYLHDTKTKGRPAKVKYGRHGYVTQLKGGIAGAIRYVTKEIEDKPHLARKDGFIDEVRSRLRECGNVISLGRGNLPGVYTTWVAETWRDELLDHEDRRTYRVKDTGQSPGGESGPVATVNLYEEFQSNPLGEVTAMMLRSIANRGGKVIDKKGFTSRELVSEEHQESAAHVLSVLEARGLATVEKKNARRFSRIVLTTRGAWVAQHLPYCQETRVALLHVLTHQRHGTFEGSSPRATTNELAALAHKNPSAVNSTLLELEAEGVVKLERTAGNDGYLQKVTLVDDSAFHLDSPPPIVVVEVEPEQVAEQEVEVVDEPQERSVTDIRDDAIRLFGQVAHVLDALDNIKEICWEVEQGHLSLLPAFTRIQEQVKGVSEDD